MDTSTSSGGTLDIHMAILEPDHPKLPQSDLAKAFCEAGCRKVYLDEEPGIVHLVSEDPVVSADLSIDTEVFIVGSDDPPEGVGLVVGLDAGMIRTLRSAAGRWEMAATFYNGSLLGIAPVPSGGSHHLMGLYADEKEAAETAAKFTRVVPKAL